MNASQLHILPHPATVPARSAPRLARFAQRLAGAAMLLAGLVGLAGCGQQNAYVEPPPPEVTVARPEQRDVVEYLEVTGTAHPVMSVDIRARVRGFLKERHFQEGALVKQGQLLLVIDEEPFRLELDQAKAQLAEAQTSLRKARQSKAREVARAQLALDEASLLQAQNEERRLRKLIANRAVTEEDIERVEANRKKAEAQVKSSQASVEQADADYETNALGAQAAAAVAQTAMRNAEIELGYCRMVSPIDGRISRVNFDVGNLVGDGQSSLLATIVKMDPIYVYTTLSESDILRFRGDTDAATAGESQRTVELGLANETGYPHAGHVDYQDPGVDPGTGTIRVRGIFPNPTGEILPGVFVRLRVPIANNPGALLVSERALGMDQAGQYLLVVGNGDLVEYRPIKTGSRVGDLRVVEGQIGPQDRVVVEGLLRARPNMKVVARQDQPSAVPQESTAPQESPAAPAARPGTAAGAKTAKTSAEVH